MLLILDNGDDTSWYDQKAEPDNEVHLGSAGHRGKTIGHLRNIANACVMADIICHWDSDDWSAPARINDQVKRLSILKKQVTGYRSMAFHDVTTDRWYHYTGTPHYSLGTSLCYYRSYWQTHHFADLMSDEDNKFGADAWNEGELAPDDGTNMMFARVHPGNTSPKHVGAMTPLPDCRHLFPGAFAMAGAAR